MIAELATGAALAFSALLVFLLLASIGLAVFAIGLMACSALTSYSTADRTVAVGCLVASGLMLSLFWMLAW